MAKQKNEIRGSRIEIREKEYLDDSEEVRTRLDRLKLEFAG
ncbi:MAG: hypothetical protein PWQ48_1894 [Thermotogaceae bacterium]|nr:hypothetical protein [Thermotogaceae bacterium]